MASNQNNKYSEQVPVSFGLDHPPAHDARHSFNHHLRLKTNQSIEERPPASIELRKDRKKPLRTEESDFDGEHCRRLAMEEYDLRIQSLVKQYQLRISKQEEFYGLKEWKMKQQFQNLEKQNHSLTEELRRVKSSNRQIQKQCPLCNDGQIINQLTKVLTENQQNHKDCISEKKQLRTKATEVNAKLQVFQQQYQKMCQQIRSMGKQIKTYQSKIKQLQQERDYAITSMKKSQKSSHQRHSVANNELKFRQRQLSQIDMELNQSKATVQSTQSVFTSSKQSMNSSNIKIQDSKTHSYKNSCYQYSQDPRQQKQNQMVQGRMSQNKIIKLQQQDYHDNKNLSYLKKMSENIARNPLAQRYQPIRRKYF